MAETTTRQTVLFDRFLHVRLPLPLAQLYARAANAVSARNRLLSAFYLHESALKLATSIEIFRYLGRGMREKSVDRLLERLALPSTGVWSALLPALAREDLEGKGIAALLAEPRDDLPQVREAIGLLSHGRVRAGDRPPILRLWEQLPGFRNRTIAGGEELARDETARLASTLLEAFFEIATRSALLDHLTLLVPESCVEAGSGSVEVRWFDLTGPVPVRTSAETRPADPEIRPGRSFAKAADGTLVPLHPLLVFRQDEFLPQVLFPEGSDPEGGLQFLDYVTGKTADPSPTEGGTPSLAQEMRAFLGRVRGAAIGDREFRELVEASARDFPAPAIRKASKAKRFGEFELLGELGRGGMGIVYLARQSTVGRLVALKIFPPALASDAVASARFQREITALGRCDHPNVVKVIAAGNTEGTSYYAMELIQGTTLAGVARTLPEAVSVSEAITCAARQDREAFEGLPDLPEIPAAPPADASATPMTGAETYREIARMMADAAKGVHHLHEHGILHRDLKPGNLMVAVEDQRVVVMDLGLAAVEGMSLTQDRGAVVGTLRYMAPEQLLRSQLEVDRRSDVYSLGATLFELVTGAPVHDGDTQARVIQQVLHEDPPKVRTLARDIPADLEAIVHQGLARNPSDRYPTAMDLAKDLERFARGEPVTARVPTAGEQLARLVKKYRTIISLVAAAFLALVSLGVVSYVKIAKERRDVLRLSDVESLAKLKRREATLWPAFPDVVPAMESWLAEAKGLVGRLDRHRKKLEDLRRRGTVAVADGEAEGGKRRAIEEDRDRILEALAGEQDENSAKNVELRRVLAEVQGRLETMEESPEPHSVEFATARDQWWHDTLEGLVRDLEAFARETVPSVERRIEDARALEEEMRRYEPAWQEAIAEIARDPTYGRLHLDPQMSLVPIGRDPDSSFWEFAHLQSGSVPERDADGKLVLTEDTGLVLVLLPGGTFTMGAVPKEPEGEPGLVNVDPGAQADEAPCHRVTLGPFLLSKYEMTQGQWVRVAGSNPSRYGPDFDQVPGLRITLRHPVERISWVETRRLLDHLGLDFPTEAQWEYAARAGTTSVFSTGDDRTSLRGYANLADRVVRDSGIIKGIEFDEWLEDGYLLHAPVGSFLPNRFGLHDVHGNVFEWCRDWAGGYELPWRPGDGERIVFGGTNREARGGHYLRDASFARSANRDHQAPTSSHGGLGVRPAHAIQGP